MVESIPTDYHVEENKIIRVYDKQGQFKDLTVDQIISLGMNRWKDWMCSAGVTHLYVGYDGDIYRGNCRVGGKLGNIYSQFDLKADWIKCTADFCGCGSDVMTPKIKDDKWNSLLKNTNEKAHGSISMRTPDLESENIVAVETAFRPPPHIRVQWDLGRRCNFNCSYCWPDVHSSNEPLKEHEILMDAATKLLDKLPADKKVLFQFGGGEPTLYPKYLDFLRFLKEKGHSIVTTTNGSRHHSFFSDLIKLTSINISVHFEFIDLKKLKKNIESILQAISAGETKETLEIKLMSPPGTVARSKNFLDELKEIPGFKDEVSWSYVPIRHGLIDKVLAAKVVDYSHEELNIIQNRL